MQDVEIRVVPLDPSQQGGTGLEHAETRDGRRGVDPYPVAGQVLGAEVSKLLEERCTDTERRDDLGRARVQPSGQRLVFLPLPEGANPTDQIFGPRASGRGAFLRGMEGECHWGISKRKADQGGTDLGPP